MHKVLPWFHLKSVPGIGNHLFKRLLEHFTSPERVFQASPEEILSVEGVTRRLAHNINAHKIPEAVKAELDLVVQKGYDVVTMSDAAYPPLLRQIPDPPAYLYVCGYLDGLVKNISVVGSRHPTGYGLSITRRLCADLAGLEMIIVSGMARGIDTAAHEGALHGKGKTVAVLGSGLEKVYPRENRKLFELISENGAVISEFPLMAEPEAHHFPIRNRIISGMSVGTIVVEASKKSGSLITARLAAEQNREVFAVPGSIQSFKSIGTHTLIKQGAKLVEHAKDVIEELSLSIPQQGKNQTPSGEGIEIASLSPQELRVFNALEPYPVHIDDLVHKISIEPGKLSSILLQLELKGLVQQSPGKLFSISTP